MKLYEVLNKLNKVRRSCWFKVLYFDYIKGVVFGSGDCVIMCVLNSLDYQADDWELILEKKKMY